MSIKESPAGNIGEWSELYTLGYLLMNGGAYGADEKQSRMENLFYKALEIYLAGRDPEEELQYKIGENQIKVYARGSEILTLEKSQLVSKVANFFRDLSNGENIRTFPLASGYELMQMLGKNSISASSTQHASDMEIIFEDRDSKLPSPRVGFSIKSQLGGASTLLNASGATNFIFRLSPGDSSQRGSYPAFEPGAVKTNVKSLLEADWKLEFQSVSSPNFQHNLELVDSRMPEYVAEVLLAAYAGKKSKFSEVVEEVFPQSDKRSEQKIFKIKQFLGAVAMGMRPSDSWDGDVTKFKGLIVVKTDGEIVFYYLYNQPSFQDFLFENVKFEVPSTSRHKFGDIYTEGGADFLKLNLQIRFIK